MRRPCQGAAPQGQGPSLFAPYSRSKKSCPGPIRAGTQSRAHPARQANFGKLEELSVAPRRREHRRVGKVCHNALKIIRASFFICAMTAKNPLAAEGQECAALLRTLRCPRKRRRAWPEISQRRERMPAMKARVKRLNGTARRADMVREGCTAFSAARSARWLGAGEEQA